VMQGPIKHIADAGIPLPNTPREIFDGDRRYPVPEIVAVTGVKVQPIRGAAYLPIEEVRVDMPYDAVGTELGDMDMVSVSGRVDLQRLYQSFQQSFKGPRLQKQTWRSDEYATPVIARVDLQRRTRLPDGRWSEWKSVSRPRIDPYGKQTDQIPLTVDQMSGGIGLLMAQCKQITRQLMLLQPQAYDFATRKAPYWIPPEFYKEYMDLLKRQEDEMRRRARDASTGAGMMTEAIPGARGGRTRPQPPARRGNRRQESPLGEFGGLGGIPGEDAAAKRPTRTRTPEDVLRDASKEFFNERTDLWTKTSALVWAHDDTTVPGQTYQYRLRLGVFNPIAGRDWFYEEQQEYKSQVVWWGPYSEPTPEVAIPRMLQVFPTDTAGEPGALEVEVAKYYMGRWQTHKFTVYPGQQIGSEVETETTADAAANTYAAAPMEEIGLGMGLEGMGMPGAMPMGGGTPANAPAKVNYSTNLIYMDLMPRAEWSEPPTIRPRRYSLMMYMENDTIGGLPVGNRNWPRQLQQEYTSIKDEERNGKNIQYQPRSTQGGMNRGIIPMGTMPGLGLEPF